MPRRDEGERSPANPTGQSQQKRWHQRGTTSPVTLRHRGSVARALSVHHSQYSRTRHKGVGMLTRDAALALADAWSRAWNAHDLDAILSHYADDVEFVSPSSA